MEFLITEAKREQLLGAIALIGPSGSGKTLGALKIAKGMMDKKYPDLTDAEKWKKIGVIDTEHERSKIYAETTGFGIEVNNFVHLDFQPPYTVERLDKAILALKKYGCEVIITDSLSHFWEGEGGVLDLQQDYGGNFQAWRQVNPHYEHLVKLATGERHEVDMINCMRAKQAYEVTQDEVGQLQVQKLGLKPVQRDSLEYEFQIVFGIDMNHKAFKLKDNSGMFNHPHQLETETGEKIYEWLKEGKDPLAEEREEKKAIIDTIHAYISEDPSYGEELVKKAEEHYGDLMNMSVFRLQDLVKAIHKNKFKEEK